MLFITSVVVNTFQETIYASSHSFPFIPSPVVFPSKSLNRWFIEGKIVESSCLVLTYTYFVFCKTNVQSFGPCVLYRYNWTCHPIDIPTEPCFDPSTFSNGTAPVPSTNGSLLFPAAWLRLDLAFQFVFYLTVSKEGRQPDYVSQVLKVVSNEQIYE